MVLKWGILGAGRISNDFVKALLAEKEKNEVTAVAARDIIRAQEFAKLYGIPKAYGDYESFAKDPDIGMYNFVVVAYNSTRLRLNITSI